MELFDAYFVYFGQTLFQSATGGGANQCLGYGAWLTAHVHICRVHSRFSHIWESKFPSDSDSEAVMFDTIPL